MQGLDVVDRLLAMLDMDGDSGCWEWRGHRQNGYGHMRVFGKRSFAHRVMLEIKLERPLLPGEVCRHVCDNPSCCNPDHLEVGSHSQNMRDATERRKFPTGANHHGSKLTEEAVADARRRYAVGDIGIENLGREYGVTYVVMRDAIMGKTWRAVSEPPVSPLPFRRFSIGERNPNNKLSPDDVRTIRARVAAGEMHSVVAKDYGVKTCTVSSIVYRRSWKHLN